jgi:hypothetical protein
MNKVYEKLIEFKKQMNSELVMLKDDKIIRKKLNGASLKAY